MHEVLAGLIPSARPSAPQREIVAHVTVARILVRPTPTPIPPSRPRVVSRTRIIAPTEPKVVPHTTTGIAARKESVHRIGAARPKPPVFSNTKPIWDIPVGANGAGAGNRSEAGSNGSGASGPGAGNSGAGSGAAAGNEPCGFVEFSDPHGSRYDPGTHGFWVDIRMSVHFPDGHSESVLLDYPWFYASEAANPWSDQNLNDPHFPTTFQSPPPEKRANEPTLVQYVITHSTREGLTLLRDCPAPAPSS
ncbi:MAG: hypothetical protein JOY69_09950 [Candidatus Eremiobacteraeota bacterium]|nr:hypothetical protein [Candidatus Eremiobacteraeota bacterium]